ncbi:hypothetical protein BV22DRAFT_982841, partial [Leucogyrophana mollusca]
VQTESAQTFAQRTNNICKDAKSALVKAAAGMERSHDDSRERASYPLRPDYKPGGYVYLDSGNLIFDRCYELFKALKRAGQLSYKFQLPHSWCRVHPV